MLVIGVRHKLMKTLMVFWPLFGLNNQNGGNFKRGCPTVNGGSKEVHTPHCPRKLWFQWLRPHALVGTWGISLAIKPEMVAVAGANMQWCHFVFPSSSQKRESTAFDLILRSAWELLSPGKQVGRSYTPCRKRSQVWGRESERWPKIYAIESPDLEMGRRVKLLWIEKYAYNNSLEYYISRADSELVKRWCKISVQNV